MPKYGYTNEDGEPIMSGEAYRFEQQLDAEYWQHEAHQDALDEQWGPEWDCDDEDNDQPSGEEEDNRLRGEDD